MLYEYESRIVWKFVRQGTISHPIIISYPKKNYIMKQYERKRANA